MKLKLSRKAKILLGAVIFCLYWSGILSFLLRSFAMLTLYYVNSMKPSNVIVQSASPELSNSPEPEEVLIEELEEEENKDNTHVQRISDMVAAMERIVDETDLSLLSDEEMRATFSKIYDLLPAMDRLFEQVLTQENIEAINPRGDYYELQRRYDNLRETLTQKRKEKEEL